nr:MAG TPA: hypothetical protein [Inoviridae sp.]DAV53257.1 MAG TPA: hypothetical protein [Inoviridae sp.]
MASDTAITSPPFLHYTISIVICQPQYTLYPVNNYLINTLHYIHCIWTRYSVYLIQTKGKRITHKPQKGCLK